VSGYMGQAYGWQSSFYLFGLLGVLLGLVLMIALREVPRGASEGAAAHATLNWTASGTLRVIGRLLTHPTVATLILVFVGANFVAAIFLTWMPSYLFRQFRMSLGLAGLNATAWLQMASVIGVLAGGYLADRAARRRPGGRMLIQALGLLAGVPFLFMTGWTLAVPVLVFSMIGFGFFKGMYDANIWASLYDVVPAEHRATGLGFMNSIGWLGAGFAPVAIARASETWGMSACLSATAAIYFAVGLLMLRGAFARRKQASAADA
jgi:sugar phosphate permease